MLACPEGNLESGSTVRWSDNRCSVGVVMASGGYPDKYETGFEIAGLDAPRHSDECRRIQTRRFSPAGVASGPSGRPVTSGGRVLTVVGCGQSVAAAREEAYTRLRGRLLPGEHIGAATSGLGA